jgi:hypothetical protein
MFVMKNSAGKVGNYSCALLDLQQTVAHLNEIQPLSSILNTHCVKLNNFHNLKSCFLRLLY